MAYLIRYGGDGSTTRQSGKASSMVSILETFIAQ